MIILRHKYDDNKRYLINNIKQLNINNFFIHKQDPFKLILTRNKLPTMPDYDVRNKRCNKYDISNISNNEYHCLRDRAYINSERSLEENKSYTFAYLRQYAKGLGLSTSGRKIDLVDRILDDSDIVGL